MIHVVGRTALLGTLSAAAVSMQLISVKQEIELGAEAQKQVKAEVPPVTDLRVTNFVTGTGKRLSARAGGPRYPYTFSVANYREINAFALPGGPVWINRGAITAATTEGQFASVLAHEVAHIAHRHAASQITKSLVANGLLGLLGAVLGNDPGGGRTAQIAAQVMAGGYMLKFSRDDEREADRDAVTTLVRAGLHPRGIPEMFQILLNERSSNPGAVEGWFSTHPGEEERITTSQQLIAQIDPAILQSLTVNTSNFAAFKSRVRSLPAPTTANR